MLHHVSGALNFEQLPLGGPRGQPAAPASGGHGIVGAAHHEDRCADAGDLLDGLDTLQTWEAVIAAEPALAVVLSDERFEAALLAIANFIDLKSPYTLGHSRAVADLAAEAASQLGLSEGEIRTVRRAGT